MSDAIEVTIRSYANYRPRWFGVFHLPPRWEKRQRRRARMARKRRRGWA